jgi:hypothetical protein
MADCGMRECYPAGEGGANDAAAWVSRAYDSRRRLGLASTPRKRA